MKRQWKRELPKPNNKLFFTFLAGSIILTMSTAIFSPMIDPQNYQRVQHVGRKSIRQEDIQPGNMKVWSDPFDKAK